MSEWTDGLTDNQRRKVRELIAELDQCRGIINDLRNENAGLKAAKWNAEMENIRLRPGGTKVDTPTTVS